MQRPEVQNGQASAPLNQQTRPGKSEVQHHKQLQAHEISSHDRSQQYNEFPNQNSSSDRSQLNDIINSKVQFKKFKMAEVIR